MSADFAALQLDDDAHAVLVGLVAQLRDALDQLAAHQVGDALEQPRLVHLVRQLGDDDGFAAVVVDLLDLGPGTHQDAAATGRVGGVDLARAVDDAGGREVRAGHQLHQLGDRDLGPVDQRDAGVDHLGQVVRRYVGRHADGDTRGAVDQQVRHPGRQHRRLRLGFVVVRDEIDRFLVDVGQQLRGEARHAHLGVAHRGRGVAVHRAEVALSVDEQVAHRERLRHAHDGVVHRRVAVRVVLADHVADDARRLLVGLVPVVAELAHRVQHAAMHGLQAVADVGQRAPHDHAHRVIEVRPLHLVFEIDVQDFAGDFGHESRLVARAGYGRPKKRNNTTGRRPVRPAACASVYCGPLPSTRSHGACRHARIRSLGRPRGARWACARRPRAGHPQRPDRGGAAERRGAASATTPAKSWTGQRTC